MGTVAIVIIASAVVVSTTMIVATGMFCFSMVRMNGTGAGRTIAADDRTPLAEAALHDELAEVAGRVRTIQRLLQDVEPIPSVRQI